MIRYLIDADSSIYAMVDASSPVNAHIGEQEPGTIAISAISFAEIALGAQLQNLRLPQSLRPLFWRFR